LPLDRTDLYLLFDITLIERTLYELGYELDHRPGSGSRWPTCARSSTESPNLDKFRRPFVRAGCWQCQAVRLSRAAYYRPRSSRLVRDADVVTALNEVVARHTRWRFWKCFHRLRRAGHRWR
jgi:hypothetical protein